MLAAQAIALRRRRHRHRRRPGEHERVAARAARLARRLPHGRREAGRHDDRRRPVGRLQPVPHGHRPPRTSRRSTRSRAQQQDEFAVASQNKAEAAQKAGKFKDEIVPVMIPQRKGDPVAFDDRRISASRARRSIRSPACGPRSPRTARVTAGNASGINDGAAAVLVMTAEARERARPQAAGAHQGVRVVGRRSGDHGHGPGAGVDAAASRRPAGRRATST